MKISVNLLLPVLLVLSVFVFFSCQHSTVLQNFPLPAAQPYIEAGAFLSLQDAIDALPEEGGVVRIPPGIFEIYQPLIINKPDVQIEGAGTATQIKNMNTEGKSALLIQHPDKGESRESELWRVNLLNFRITGNEKSGHGIEARWVNEIFIQGITVSYHGGDGILLYNCYEDPRVSNSLITYIKIVAYHTQVESINTM